MVLNMDYLPRAVLSIVFSLLFVRFCERVYTWEMVGVLIMFLTAIRLILFPNFTYSEIGDWYILDRIRRRLCILRI